MATTSIFRNITLDTPQKVKAFVRAVFRAQKLAETQPVSQPALQTTDITKDQLNAFMTRVQF